MKKKTTEDTESQRRKEFDNGGGNQIIDYGDENQIIDYVGGDKIIDYGGGVFQPR